MADPQPLPASSSGGLPSWLFKIAGGLGLLADVALIVLLLGAVEALMKGMGSSLGLYAIFAWAVALMVSIIAPFYALKKWKQGQRGIAVASVWLPPLGLLVGAFTAL